MTAEAARIVTAQRSEAKDHNLVPEAARQTVSKGVQYEKRPVKGTDGKPVAGLFNAWITLDNQTQFNSYTTDMVKATILAFRAASTARDVVAVVFTGAGDKAFCTGGNTKEYAEYYAGNPQEYRGYMRLFNDMGKEKYRLVVEGPPNYTNFRQFWKMFYDEGAVVVASSYTKVGGVYDFGFRHDPDKPLETLAEYCLGVYTNRSLPMRIDMLVNYINEYEADGLLINSIKSCNSFSAGQLLMMREVEKRTGKPAAFVESDLVDPRYFSAANIKNRLESYFQMIDQKRAGAEAAA